MYQCIFTLKFFYPSRDSSDILYKYPCLLLDPSVDQGIQAGGQQDATEEGDVDEHSEWVEKLQFPVVTNYWDILVKVLRVVKEFVLPTGTN